MRVSVALLGLAVGVGFAGVAWAGQPPAFTPQDFALQETFLQHLISAKQALAHKDIAKARTQLREAARDGGYQFDSPERAFSGCGGSSGFLLPLWLPQAQALLGDADGARQSAKSATSASYTLYALTAIADAQAGNTTAYPWGQFVAFRALPETDGMVWPRLRPNAKPVRLIPVNCSAFANPRVRPRLDEARATLRAAVPFAVAQMRRSIARAQTQVQEASQVILPDFAAPVTNLATKQAQAGDLVGARDTLNFITAPWERAATLAQIAASTSMPVRDSLLVQARQEINALPQPQERVNAFLLAAWAWQNNPEIWRTLHIAALNAATQEKDSQTAHDLLMVVAWRFEGDQASGVHTPRDVPLLIAALKAARNAAAGIPDVSKQCFAFSVVGDELKRAGSLGEARQTRELAHQAALKIADPETQTTALLQLASTCARAGDETTMKERLGEARAAADRIPNQKRRTRYLERINDSVVVLNNELVLSTKD